MRKWVLFVVAAAALLVALPGCGDDCDVVPSAPVVEQDDDCRDRDDDGRDSLVSYPRPRPPK